MFTPVDYDFASGKTLSDYGLEASTAFPFASAGFDGNVTQACCQRCGRRGAYHSH